MNEDSTAIKELGGKQSSLTISRKRISPTIKLRMPISQ